jgi:hypothetical protein
LALAFIASKAAWALKLEMPFRKASAITETAW